MASVVHPALRPWLEIAMHLGGLAAEAAAKRAQLALRPRRSGSYRTRRPGAETPLWNSCSALLREELKAPGAKVRLARYLGIPKQRVADFFASKTRLPDAELTLQLVCWIAEKRAARDSSL
jgi:hypothetical protein